MKIRDLDLDQYVIVYDIGKSEHNEGMTVVGRVEEIVFNDDNDNVATINSLGNLYDITDDNDFELWSKSIEGKTEHIGFDKENTEKSRKLLSNDVQQCKRRNIKLIDSETVEFENGKQMKVIVNNGKQPTSVYWIDDTTIGFDNGSRVRIPENYATEYSHDTVNHPSHYNYGDIEVINFIEQVTKHYNANVAYHIGNAIKYLARSPHKNGKEDIEKARWYIERVFENWDK